MKRGKRRERALRHKFDRKKKKKAMNLKARKEKKKSQYGPSKRSTGKCGSSGGVQNSNKFEDNQKGDAAWLLNLLWTGK